jgi:transglutaminase-like putative cysteine protease
MLLQIHHETIYQYSELVDYSIQQLRLTPRLEAQQRAHNWKIHTTGQSQRHTDAYGNIGHILVMDTPHDEIRIQVSGQITVNEQTAHLPSDGGEVPLLTYLQETRLTMADDAIRDLALRSQHYGDERIKSVFRMVEAILDQVTYLPGSSDVASTAIDTLARGAGVCQDHAHLFIAACRTLDLPARYVSGYIHPGNSDHAASHAWADVWIEEMGWVSIDITHGRYANAMLCRLAVGRDYLDACPIRGVRQGGGNEAMQARVYVRDAQQ